MKIDKRSGKWNFKEATDLDNLAYYIYTQRNKEDRVKYRFPLSEQLEFCRDFKMSLSYKEAILILRRQKIEKIRNGRLHNN